MLGVGVSLVVSFEFLSATEKLRADRGNLERRSAGPLQLSLTPRVGKLLRAENNNLKSFVFAGSGQIVLSQRVAFNASQFQVACINTPELLSNKRAYLIWSTAAAPATYHRLRILSSITGCNYVDMTVSSAWRGEVIEIGLDIYYDEPESVFALRNVTLFEIDYVTYFKLLLSQWFAFEKWGYSTINRVDSCDGYCLFSPTPSLVLTSFWIFLSWFLIGGKKENLETSIVIAMLFCWLLLSTVWNVKLVFAYKDAIEESGSKNSFKQLALLDHVAVQRTALMARGLIPLEARVFILHQSANQNFERTLLQYFLLPRRIYNFGQFPPKRSIKPDDYIITIGNIPKLKADPIKGRLTWQTSQYSDFVNVVSIHLDPYFSIFRVSSAEG